MGRRRYRITGVVQGVGFRPFVHRIASANALRGWVLNDSEGVLVEIDGDEAGLDGFLTALRDSPPPLAQIDLIRGEALSAADLAEVHTDFEIRESVQREETKTLVPPDSFVCPDCVAELFDPDDRRHRYPFINCTNCGPRFSIIESMPYDRPKTTMRAFEMCEACDREYHDIRSRRYHAQPNACPVCGPRLQLCDRSGAPVATDDIVGFVKQALREGKILAVKSIGGFHLAVDARNDAAVRSLRKRKRRDAKPFALMVRDLEAARAIARVSTHEQALLQSPPRPIVILAALAGVLPESIAPGNPSYGVMLPSAPLHHLLLEDAYLDTLVMTSGNVSERPIVYTNADALAELGEIADYFLFNDRDIHLRVDDSIVRETVDAASELAVTSYIRRARGYAPMPVTVARSLRQVLALGPELKATLALSKGTDVYLSQHIGDIKNDQIFASLINFARHFEGLLSISPEAIACDAHPGFRTNDLVSAQELPVVRVQHHHAHMAACMADNGLDGPTIGVIFDGGGFGLDGSIWGGEFLLGDFSGFTRVASLRRFQLLGGDRAIREPRRLAVDVLCNTYGDDFAETTSLPFLDALDPDQLRVFGKMSAASINAFPTSSIGRLFDAVSALIGVRQEIEYEAQAAIELEALLVRDLHLAQALPFDIDDGQDRLEIDFRPTIRALVGAITAAPEVLSRRFHSTVVAMIGETCELLREHHGRNDVVLSGGVFLNEFLLVNAIRDLRRRGFAVHHHRRVPTNDGGVSLGQVMVANHQLDSKA